MRLNTVLGAVALFTSMSLIGCSHTEAGLEQDANQNAPKIQKAADKAEDATKKALANAEEATKKATANMDTDTKHATKNADAALMVTPKVKLAISSDPELNDKRNTINVDSADSVVHLRGTVYSQHLKNKAGQIAKKVLEKINATDTVSNELEVTK